MLIVFTWYLALQLFALAAWPLAFSVCNRLFDRGYAFSKGLGLLLITYITWVLAHLAPRWPGLGFSFGTVSAAWFAVLVVSLICLTRNFRELGIFIRRNLRHLVLVEALFLMAFAAMVAVKATVPHISYHVSNPMPGSLVDHAAEKFTDFAVLNSLLTSSEFPPHDAWLSGHTLNYYYFGHMLWAVLIKFCSVRPEIGFNLGMAGAFAICITLAYGLGYNLTRKIRYGLLTMFLIVLASNLDGFLQMVSSLKMTFIDGRGKDLWYLTQPWYQNYDFWRSSRALANTINEFPAFSFILGDLHAHLSALVINLCGWNLAVQVFRNTRQYRSLWRYELNAFDELIIAAIICGALSASNSWDVPMFAGVLALAMWCGSTGRRDPYAFEPPVVKGIGRFASGVEALIVAVIVALIGVALLFQPFMWNFRPPAPEEGGLIKLVAAENRSDTFEFVAHWLMLAIIPMIYYVVSLRSRRRSIEPSDPATDRRRTRTLALLLLTAAAAIIMVPLLQGWIAVITLGMSIIVAAGLIANHYPPVTRWIHGLLLMFFVFTFFCEIWYVDDIFSGPIERINTVFKIYYGLWPLMAVTTILSIRMLVAAAPPHRRIWRATWLVAPLLLAGAPYMILGTMNRITSSTRLGHWDVPEDSPIKAPPSALLSESARAKNLEEALDGMRYLAFLHPDDYAAINWVRANVPLTARILEAAGSQYTYSGRFGTMTGRPSFAGWLSHAWGWRGSPFGRAVTAEEAATTQTQTERDRRIDRAAEIYNEIDPVETLRMLREEKIMYVILGENEREQYPSLNEEKFPTIGKEVFREGGTSIYKIIPGDAMPTLPEAVNLKPQPPITMPMEVDTETTVPDELLQEPSLEVME